MMQTQTRPYLLHALTPLHVGTGQSIGVIDLPIARMRATGIPIVPGSSVKGVLHDARRSHDDAQPNGAQQALLDDIFGTPNRSGTLIVTEARLLALPVRSFYGTFAWVTSSLLLELAARDCAGVHDVPAVPAALTPHGAVVLENSVNNAKHKACVYLEDLDIEIQSDKAARQALSAWASFLAPLVAPQNEALLTRRFMLVDDETMTFLWETATQVDTRVRLQEESRTVTNGALWTEESLPAETLLMGLLLSEPGRTGKKETGSVLDEVLRQEEILQFGGKATVGKGRCRIVPITPPAAGAK